MMINTWFFIQQTNMTKSGIKWKIKTLNGGKELFYDKNCVKTGISTDHDLPLNKPLKFPTLTIILRCVFQEGENLYLQIYLDEACMSYKNVTV